MARSAALTSLVAELGEWAAGPGPIYRQLARAVAGAIERGAVARGTRLPAERAVAGALAVSRGTAVAAYDLLVSDGLIERRRGSGTTVLGAAGSAYAPGQEGSALVHRLVDRSSSASTVIDLSLSVLADASDLPDLTLTTADLLDVSPPTGLSPWGLPSLRARLADHISNWGLASTAGQIVVTTGAQQAISVVAACWVRPGDTVALDDPTYPGAIAAFRQAGAELIGIPMDAEGPRPDAVAEVLRRRPALLYLQSGVHSPTGVAISARRTRQLARLIAAARVPFVEDRALADLTWRPPAPPIAASLPGTSTVVIGSLSKIFWGGLRIGFARAEEPLALRLARIQATRNLGTSAISQAIAERLLLDVDRTALRVRRKLAGRADVLQRALHAALPGATWPDPHGGMSLWVRLPGAEAAEIAALAPRFGVAIATPDSISVSSAYADRVRLSFSGPSADLRRGARRLGAAWSAVTR